MLNFRSIDFCFRRGISKSYIQIATQTPPKTWVISTLFNEINVPASKSEKGYQYRVYYYVIAY